MVAAGQVDVDAVIAGLSDAAKEQVTRETYDYNKMLSTAANGSTHRGLNGEQIRTALSQLLGVNTSASRPTAWCTST